MSGCWQRLRCLGLLYFFFFVVRQRFAIRMGMKNKNTCQEMLHFAFEIGLELTAVTLVSCFSPIVFSIMAVFCGKVVISRWKVFAVHENCLFCKTNMQFLKSFSSFREFTPWKLKFEIICLQYSIQIVDICLSYFMNIKPAINAVIEFPWHCGEKSCEGSRDQVTNFEWKVSICDGI